MGRIGLVLGNVAILIPVFALLVTAAVISTMGSKSLAKIKDNDLANVRKWIRYTSIGLWVLFLGGLIFMLTFGMFIIPLTITIPYLYGGAMILLALLYIAISGVFFYAVNKLQGTKAYKDDNKDAKDAHKNFLICGVIMIFAALFMIGYAIYSIHKYRQEGGLTGDIALAGQFGGDIAMALGQPELAAPLKAVGGAAQGRLDAGQQQKAQQRLEKAGALQQQFQPQLQKFGEKYNPQLGKLQEYVQKGQGLLTKQGISDILQN